MPAREPRSSEGPRRLETAQAVALVGKFVPAREPGSIKGPRHSETAQAEASAGKKCAPGAHGSSKVRVRIYVRSFDPKLY